MMKCHELEQFLSDYLENSLAKSDLENVRRHLNSCEACNVLLKEMEASLILCKSFPELEPPSRLVETILIQTSGQYRSLSWLEYVRELFRPVYSPRFAAGACLAAISFVMVMNAFGIRLNQIERADLTPKGILQRVNRTVYLAYDNSIRRINDLKILYQIQSKIDELRTQQAETEDSEGEKPKKSSKPQENSATEYLVSQKVFVSNGSLSLTPEALRSLHESG